MSKIRFPDLQVALGMYEQRMIEVNNRLYSWQLGRNLNLYSRILDEPKRLYSWHRTADTIRALIHNANKNPA